MTLLAGQTAVWLGLGLAAGPLFALAVWAALAVFFVVFDGDADHVADVQRFVALTEEARSWVPAGLPLFDGEKAAATTAALVRFQAKKDEARRALSGRRETGAPQSRAQSPSDAASSESKLAVANPAIGRRAPPDARGTTGGTVRHPRQKEELIAQDDRIDTRPARRG